MRERKWESGEKRREREREGLKVKVCVCGRDKREKVVYDKDSVVM